MNAGDGKIDIESMRREHLPPVLDLINAEGWEYELIDVQRILDVDPDNSVVALSNGEVVGGVTVACHKNRGVLGHVVVKTGWRKSGIGKRMMIEVLGKLDARKIGIVELYSVPDAMEFYKKLGFRNVSHLTIYKGNVKNSPPPSSSNLKLRALTADDLYAVIELDTRIAGYDRSNVIEKLMLPYLESSIGLFDKKNLKGFALGRKAEVEAEVGPWIMERPDKDDGANLIAKTMNALDNRKTFIEIPGENPLANSIVLELGFEAKTDVHRFVRTKLDVPKFGRGVMSYAALEFG
jgi:N-acetylglutamate synthase-like GNAT family acetyltransferase